MPDIEIKRGYEVLPDNNVRFGIRVINNSDYAISDVEVLLDYSDSLFELLGNKVQKLGNIPPTVPRTAKFIFKPLGCIHKENIGATIIYKDHQWKKHTIEMKPKEVHCVCPFLKEKSIKRSEFLTMSKSGFLEERGVNFEGITVEKLVEFISHTCKNRLYKVDEFPIENGKIIYLAGDALGEKAYYLLTAVVKEYEGLTQVLLRANSDKKYGINGFLNEILDNLRHLVISASTREIGIIKKEQVINIIDSVVQRSSFSVSDGTASVNVQDSIVQRAEIKADEERKEREEERFRKEREEQERLEEEQRREKEEQERRLRLKDQQQKARMERKAQEEAERREKEKARQEEDRLRGKREEKELITRERKEKIREEETKTSKNKFFAVVLVIGLLALGYWALVPISSDPSQPLKSTPSQTAAIIQNPKIASTASSTITTVYTLSDNFKNMGDGLRLTPAGANRAYFINTNIIAGTEMQTDILLRQVQPDSFYGKKIIGMYAADFSTNSWIELHDLGYDSKNDGTLKGRTEPGMKNIVITRPLVYGHSQNVDNVLKLINDPDSMNTSYPEFKPLLDAVDYQNAAYALVLGTRNRFSDINYMGLTPAGGKIELVRAFNITDTKSIPAGFSKYNPETKGNILVIKTTGNYEAVMAENDNIDAVART